MAKPKTPRKRVVKKMSPLAIARAEAELLVLSVELKARFPDLLPAKLRALEMGVRQAMGLIP